ncbi:5-(carboxyamino)imidazole ribonucleotide synthase [Microbacterium sp.]|uniref:5-(carboxyamino)imidazole ribonucleotide synthase n=1 Tax=Microbacterium sp. TaxID=51671 RepID=UPI002810BB11|nr:5-(carboxyamino)imidazole ribonucleotide synthase [Microbacterium sp.]
MSMRVGVVGGGQLARMMIAPAVELGVELRVLAEGEAMAASLAATAIGDYKDADTVLTFAQDVDVVTFDHEHVPQPVLRALVEAGVRVHPGPDALQFAQDKLAMRRRLAELGAPQPDWAAVADEDELRAFLEDHGGRAVVKTPRGGYDGKGVRVVSHASEASDWFASWDGPLLAEELVPFTRELAQQVARRAGGEVVAYPVVETVQRDGVCAEVIAPAPRASEKMLEVAARLGVTIAEGLDVTGMLAVELFETEGERILVNELAMRPHNSGHWTQDGAVTSQFEQHLRAVLDLPLGATDPLADWAVMVNILGGPASGGLTDRFAVAMADHSTAKIHTYGKDPRPGRKVGHVNAVGDDLEDVVYEARAAAEYFS